jgi:uncharacterized YigZ family protein
MPQRYRTLAHPIEHWLPPIKGSRFVGLAAPITDENAAQALLSEAKSQWSDARHHCLAWRLVDGRFRSSDDGEPGGSAGRPILAQIEGHDLQNVAVVVTRWFGGVKLGVGGLIRAYGGCAGKTLDQGELIEVVPKVTLSVTHDYGDTGAVQALLSARGLSPSNAQWGAQVHFQVEVPFDEAAELRGALIDRTGARAVVTIA